MLTTNALNLILIPSMIEHQKYMHRCIRLAKLAQRATFKNPIVGAVLVYNDNIIGEGYHEKYGEAHAEVNCINSVAEKNKTLIPKSILYVNLEPCNHTGKTPPCTLAIKNAGIKKVIIGTEDLNPIVASLGITELRRNDIEIISGLLSSECYELNKVFFTNQNEKRAFIKLKWAETANGYIGETEKNLTISNQYTNVISHKHRTQIDGILVGYNTALQDNPALNARHWVGPQPARIFLDWECLLPSSIIKKEGQRNIVLNRHKTETIYEVEYVCVEKSAESISSKLLEIGICSVIVEGGAQSHKLFLKDNIWDEAIIIQSDKIIADGISAARLHSGRVISKTEIKNDTILQISNSKFLK